MSYIIMHVDAQQGPVSVAGRGSSCGFTRQKSLVRSSTTHQRIQRLRGGIFPVESRRGVRYAPNFPLLGSRSLLGSFAQHSFIYDGIAAV